MKSDDVQFPNGTTHIKGISATEEELFEYGEECNYVVDIYFI